MTIAGRVDEQQTLAQLLTTPSWRVLLGNPGSGKTTLLKWLTTEAHSMGVPTLVVRPVEIEASIAMSALSDVVSRTSSAVRSRLSPTHQEVLNDLIIANPVDDPGLIRAASTALFAALAQDGPLLLVLDDAHWIDQQSAETLSFAIRRSLRGHSLVAAFRTHERSLLLDALIADESETVMLGKLPDAAIASIIESEGELTPSLRFGLAQYANGNALRAREIGRAAKRGAEAFFTAETVRPQSNPLVSAAQLFPSEHLEVLYVASQLRDPSIEMLTKVFPAEQLRGALVASGDAGHSMTIDGHVQFDHPLFGEAVASLLSAGQRRELHGRVAQFVDDLIERGRHLSLSSVALDQATRIEVFVASTHAAANGSITLALQLAFRAVDGLTIPDLSEANAETFMYVNSQRWIANLEFRLDDPGAAERRLRALLQRLPQGRSSGEPVSPKGRAPVQGEHHIRVSLDLAMLLSWSQTLSVGIDTYQSVLNQPDASDASIAEAGMQLAMLQVNAVTVDAATVTARRGVQAGHRAGGQVEAESMAIDVFTRFLHGEGFDDRTLERASEKEDLENWLSVQCPPFSLGPFMYSWCEDARAFDQFAIRRRVFRVRGSGAALLMGIPFEVNMLCSRAKMTEARDLVQLGLTVAEFENELAQSLSQLANARLLAHLGDVTQAERLLAMVEASFAKLEFKLGTIEAANVRMGMLSSASDWPAVERLGRSWLDELLRSGFHEPAVVPGLLDLIEAAGHGGMKGGVGLELLDLLIGRLDAATDAARPDLIVAQQWARAHRSGLTRDESERTREIFGQTIDGFLASGRVFWAARARLALGRVERREGARRAASDLFRLALEGFTQCEALLWCDIVRSEDKRLSGRTNDDELTPIELQVATMAAAGQSNKEIAAVLFIAPKTVESHLSSAYRKLGITRRTQLHSALSS
jgi:DNA-binding CsgD family transcriptional regulator